MFLENKFYFTAVCTNIMPVHIIIYFVATDIVIVMLIVIVIVIVIFISKIAITS